MSDHVGIDWGGILMENWDVNDEYEDLGEVMG